MRFLENYENRLSEGCISGGWDFLDYADYSECHSLNREESEEEKVMQLVEHIIYTACENTATGDWRVYAQDVCEDFDITMDEYIELYSLVVDELCKRDEIVHLGDVGNFNIVLELDTDYCKKFEGRIYEYSNGELKKKDSLADKIEEAVGQIKSDARFEKGTEINKER